MEAQSHLNINPCRGRTCGYAVYGGDMGCDEGGSCFEAIMLEAKESSFHDADLKKATLEIKRILEPLQEKCGDRQLTFVQTKLGTLLAWVRHDIEVPADAVREDSSEEDTIKALGLLIPDSRK